MSWVRAVGCALPRLLLCAATHRCAPRWVRNLCGYLHCDCAVPGLFCYCSAAQSLDIFHKRRRCCCDEQFADWAQKSVWWWRERRCCKILSLLSSWGYGQEETARGCVMLHSLAFSLWFLGTPQLVLPAFLAISNMFDPIISCVAVSRLIFSCLLTISQVSQAGTGFSDSRLHAGAWQTQLSRCNLLRLTSSSRHLAVNLKQNVAFELPLGVPQYTF